MRTKPSPGRPLRRYRQKTTFRTSAAGEKSASAFIAVVDVLPGARRIAAPARERDGAAADVSVNRS